jgi:hypothetical protein
LASAVRITITAYVDNGSYPGWVECRLVDAYGRTWMFREKEPVVSAVPLDAASAYPHVGEIACEVLGRAGGVVTVSTALPWGIESVEGVSRFDVPESALIEGGR